MAIICFHKLSLISPLTLRTMDIKYRLETIAETEFRMNYEFDYSEFNPDKLQIQVGHEIKPIMERDQIAIKVKASFVYGDGEILLVSNSVLMTFGLLPIKDIIVMKDDGTFTSQNPMIIDTFLVAAMGALRGIMLKNLKGTQLEHYYIPLIQFEKIRPKEKCIESCTRGDA